ncbi:unnamed protein product, partial [Polarella glacialis]
SGFPLNNDTTLVEILDALCQQDALRAYASCCGRDAQDALVFEYLAQAAWCLDIHWIVEVPAILCECMDGLPTPAGPVSSQVAARAAVVEAARRLLPAKAMTPWQEKWCTPKVVDIYLKGRKGDVAKAGEILARALRWRQENRDIISGERVPNWQGDMRVLTRSKEGHPVVYMCAKNQPRFPSSTDLIDHSAAVLEAAVRAMPEEITTIIAVADFHGFRLMSNLNPRPVVALAGMLKQPYRDRLQIGIVVDAPASFATVWALFSKMMGDSTANKIKFYDKDTALEYLKVLVGTSATDAIARVMAVNRVDGREAAIRLPSELDLPLFATRPAEAGRGDPRAALTLPISRTSRYVDATDMFSPMSSDAFFTPR